MRAIVIAGLLFVGGCLTTGCSGNTKVLSLTAPQTEDQPILELKGPGIDVTIRAIGIEFGHNDEAKDAEDTETP